MYLVWLQVLDGVGQVVQQLPHKRLLLLQLQHHKLALALIGDLEEGVTRHVLQAGNTNTTAQQKKGATGHTSSYAATEPS
jgi:hypothetical protein